MLARRDFLGTLISAALAGRLRAADARRPRILLRSSWQVVNIGDIAHTPGVLALLERFLPEAEVVLWASGDLSEEVAAMEHGRFPKLQIVKGSINDDGRATTAALGAAVASTDFLLHGSGASFVAAKDVAAFVKHTGKPFGVYGITYSGAPESQRDLLSKAQFVFFRDSVSLAKAKDEGVSSPVMEFGPDGAFACDLKNDAAAETFLQQHGLEPKRFLCCIPRLRYTPYWLIKSGRALDAEKDRRNTEMAEQDHAPLRAAISAVVQQTGCKVLVCPEDMTQMQVGKEHIVDKLSEDVRQNVVWRENFWLTDEALSTYRRSAGLFGLEMHSPIMCIGHGIPAIVGRFAEQTSKGIMWRDIGLGDWLFDMDRPEEVARYPQMVLRLLTHPDECARRVAAARAVVAERQGATMTVVRQSVTG
ncbi:MAG: polysaccharide pyruvyl transferase family protein [Planctomycetaceae bacterium]|nr:polysaccharide pyruvyl transferase family protein [Planctomycetaceae bacterium]